jgi:3-phosphoshikimate 1-carboxyvinyltransferase
VPAADSTTPGLVRIRPGSGIPVDLGAPALPGSKSHTQRALLLAMAHDAVAPRRLRGASAAHDVRVLAAALRALGAAIDEDADGLLVRRGLPVAPRGAVDLAENGTALRMLPMVVALLGGAITVDAAPGLRRRPIDALATALTAAGLPSPAPGAWPWHLDARTAEWPDALAIDASTTTQVASGALIGMALRRAAGLGPTPRALAIARPTAPGYIDLTARLARDFGFAVRLEPGPEPADLHAAVEGRSQPVPADHAIPPDPSAAVFVMALAALHGHDAPFDRVGDDPHPELRGAREDLARLRDVALDAALELPVTDHPDAFPALCIVAAATRRGETRLTGAAALRHKESDRIAAMHAGLSAAGVACDELPDGLVIRGPWRPPRQELTLPAPADHRIVMALALLGTLPEVRAITLPHRDAVDKSWPDFFDWVGRVADVE